MKRRRILHASILSALVALLNGCLFDPGREERTVTGPAHSGHARIQLQFDCRPSVLGKSAAADTVFTLDSLIVELTSPDLAPIEYRYPVSGRADTGDIVVPVLVYELPSARNWKARIYSIDTTTTPLRRDTVHIDSVIFAVLPADTVVVSKKVSPAYSILRVRFLSSSADSIGSGVKYLRLRVNGVTHDSISLRGGAFNDVYFASRVTGWVVADSGRIYKSNDSGAVWSAQVSGTNRNLRAAWFPGTSNGWVVGDGGTILATGNGGATWSAQSGATAWNLNHVQFPSASIGYAVGDSGIMLKTVNGGSSWYAISGHWYRVSSGTTADFRDLVFTSGNTGYAAGASGQIRRTTDAGVTWSSQNSTVSQTLNGLYFYDADEGYAVGASGRILRTTNGGSSWSAQTSGSADLQSVTLVRSTIGIPWLCWLFPCTDNVTGLAVGNGGTIRRSTNATSWSAATSGTTANLNDVVAFDPSGNSNNFRAYVVGNGGVIRVSTDRGSAWSAQASGTTANLNAIHCQSADLCWVVGNSGVILKTANAGADWAAQASGVSANLRKVHFLDANTGYVSGEAGVVLRTVNGGATWSRQATGRQDNLNAVVAIDGDTALAVGAGGMILRTRAAGVPVTSQHLYGAYFLNDDGHVVGAGGITLRTRDAGANWGGISGGAQTLRSVFVSPSGNNVYAVGDAGHYRYMPNAGSHTAWVGGSSGTTANLHDVWVSAGRIYAVGDSGIIRTGTSYGNLSGSLSSGTTEKLSGVVCFSTVDVCWAVGGNETVQRTLNGTTWAERNSGAKLFEKMLFYKYLRSGVSNSVRIQAIDRESPLRGYQSSFNLVVGAGVDSTIHAPLTRCGTGYPVPACTP